MARIFWTEAGPITTTERVPLEYVEQTETAAAASVADPVPLGLAAFGLTTFLFGAIYAFFGTPAAHLRLLIPIAFWFGGIVQFLAAMWAMRKGSTFAATVMGVLSGFWLTWAGLTYLGPTGAGTDTVLGIYFGLFGVITAYLFVAACRVNLAMAGVLGITTLAFWASACGVGLTEPAWMVAAGWCAIVTGVVAFYTSFAMVLDSAAQNELLPLGYFRLPGLTAGDTPSRALNGTARSRSASEAPHRSPYDSAAGLIGSKGCEVASPAEYPPAGHPKLRTEEEIVTERRIDRGNSDQG
jgi:uncharacterized protein